MSSRKAGVLILSLVALACDDQRSPLSEPTDPAADPAGLESAGPTAATTSGRQVFGVDLENNLVVFRLDNPGKLIRKVRITGTGRQKVEGIDFRPSAVAPAGAEVIGKLYGITRKQIYEIDPSTGAASNGRVLTVPLEGVSFGAGFNPTVDRFRAHGNATQNVRLSVDNGMATLDTALAYVAGDPGFGTVPSIAGTAYTNSDNDPMTGTVLYAIDARTDALVVLPTPNGGQLTTVGRLRVATTNMVGFDIPGAPSADPFGYVSLTDPSRGRSRLFRIDLSTGRLRLIGRIGNQAPLVSIALAP